MASHKGRHRRPSRAAKIIAPVTGTLAVSGAIAVLGISGAQAQVIPVGSPTRTAVQAFALIRSTTEQSPGAVTVHSGDSLSSLAQKYCGNPKDWTGWWNYN